MTNPVGYDENGNPRFKTRDFEDTRSEERAERLELERMKNRWSLARMFKRAVEWVKRNPGK